MHIIHIEKKINAVDGQGLANNCDRQIQRHTTLGFTFYDKITGRSGELCDVTLSIVEGQKFKAQLVILSTSGKFFKAF